MNSTINLLPANCRETLRRRQTVRRWIAMYACTIVMLWLAFMMVSAGRGSLVVERDKLSARVQENWERNVAAQKLVDEINEVETRIERYTELAWPVRMSEVVNEIAAVTPSSVTLTGLTFTPREERKRSRDKKGKDEVKTRLLVEVEGVVVNDMEAATFVSGLDTHALFGSVVLDFSKQRDIDGVDGRAFRMTCQVDLSSRYAFVDATAEVGE